MIVEKPSMSIKQLFDSEYIKPIDNPRVIQDTNPVKSAAFADALSRFEHTL